ncbi:MAG: adenine deaminase C-terminal domain-containing protein [Bacteroidales bacterium]
MQKPNQDPFSEKAVCRALIAKGMISMDQAKEIFARKDRVRDGIEKSKADRIKNIPIGARIINPTTIVDVIAALKFKREDNPALELDEDAVFQVLAAEWGMVFKKIDPVKLELNLVTTTIPRSFAMKHLMLPIAIQEGALVVATSNPFNAEGNGHINVIVKRLLDLGYNLFDVLSAASLNPTDHYNTGAGLLRIGDNADFIIIENLNSFRILETYIGGLQVFDGSTVKFISAGVKPANRFNSSMINSDDIATDVNGRKIRVIEAFDGLLFTGTYHTVAKMPVPGMSDTENDILKIVVKERYHDNKPVAGFIKGFGIKKGAIASSVAHDSHNIVAVGTDDELIVRAVNSVVEMRGGLSWCGPEEELSLQLNIGGIMSEGTVADAAAGYRELTDAVRRNGSPLQAPFMTLSFMALLVIPELKIGDRGLFDVRRFEPVPLLV